MVAQLDVCLGAQAQPTSQLARVIAFAESATRKSGYRAGSPPGPVAVAGRQINPAGQVAMQNRHHNDIPGSCSVTGLSGKPRCIEKSVTPDRVALHCGDLRFTFAEFDAAAARVATLLDKAGNRAR